MNIIRLPRFEGNFYITTCCLHDCMATICNYYGEDVKPIFYDYMAVEYKRTSENISCKDLKLNINPKVNMKDCFGIEMTKAEFSENIINQFEELINKKEGHIVVLMYSYYCPWDNAYHAVNCEKRFQHYFIIEDYKRASNEFVCTDPYYNRKDVTISYSEFLQGYISHFEVKRKKSHNLPCDTIKNQLDFLKSTDYYQDLHVFFDDYMKIFSTQYPIAESFGLELHYLLLSIKCRCYYFGIYILHLAEQGKICDYSNLLGLCKNIFDKWNIVDSLVLKEIVNQSGNYLIDNVKSKIKIVINEEKELLSHCNIQ